MELLNIDVGLKSYQLVEGGEPLVFNPCDPEIYARFMRAKEKMAEIEAEAQKQAQTVPEEQHTGEEALKIISDGDKRLKSALNEVFGNGNNFDKILCGVSLLAIAGNGKQVMVNLLEAITPIIANGAKSYADQELATAKRNREQRRALSK